MKKFTDEEIVSLHECLKKINITSRAIRALPPPDETDYYINVLKELMDRLPSEEQLAIYIFMTQETILNVLANDIDIDTGIIEVD